MLTLITGTPGAGKSLRAMMYVAKELDSGTGRRIVGNVEGVDPGIMSPLEGEWYEEPDGTLVVLDEAQTYFRPAAWNAALPERVTRLETHRHHGIDIILTTQHPKLIHHEVRRLVGYHEHVVRRSQAHVVTIHAMHRAFDVDDWSEKKDSETTIWKHPKRLYGLYQSSQIHTDRPRIPRKLLIGGGVAAACVLVGGLSWYHVFTGTKAVGGGADRVQQSQRDTHRIDDNLQTVGSRSSGADTVRVVGAIWDDQRCWLLDDEGRRVDVEWSRCMELVDSLPKDITL